MAGHPASVLVATARSPFSGRLGLFAAVGAIAAAPGLREYVTTPHLSGDTFLLVEQMNNAISAIDSGQWSGWGGHFPLLQHIPALLFRFESLDSAAIQASLAYLNLLLFAILLWWSWLTLRRRSAPVAVIFVVVLLAGPLP